jgi:hypothetical protein
MSQERAADGSRALISEFEKDLRFSESEAIERILAN